jgi:hypothetical protein
MTILLVGAVYWVWTQIQYVQRKVNALENIVYELKTLCSSREPSHPLPLASYPPAPPSEIGEEDADLLEETLRKEADSVPDTVDMNINMDISEDLHDDIQDDIHASFDDGTHEKEIAIEEGQHPLMTLQEDELQPGGVGSGVGNVSYSSSLDSMSVKELRRLAVQKGISGAAEMKKKDLVVAIRSMPMESFLE